MSIIDVGMKNATSPRHYHVLLQKEIRLINAYEVFSWLPMKVDIYKACINNTFGNLKFYRISVNNDKIIGIKLMKMNTGERA